MIEIEKSLILTEKVSHYGYFSRSDSWLSADQHWMKQVGKSTLETTPRFVGRNLASEGDDIAKRPTDWQRANVSPFSAEKQRDENAPSISHLPLGGKRSRRRKRYLFPSRLLFRREKLIRSKIDSRSVSKFSRKSMNNGRSEWSERNKIIFIIPVGRRFIGDTVEFQRHPVSSAGGCAVNEMFHETSGRR